MLGCKTVDTPMEPNLKLGETNSNNLVEKGRYQHGKIIYLSHARPDIALTVSCVSQFMHAPLEEHMIVVYRILRYLRGTLENGLFSEKREGKNVEIFTYVDWAGLISDKRSTSGYCSFVCGIF